MPATPVVYIDVVWLINLVMDATLLWTTAWLLKRKVRMVRIFLGGLLGACYALLLFFPALSLLTTWPGKAIMSVAIVFISIPRKNMLDLARLVLVYYFVSFMFAGAAVALGFAIPGISLGKSISVSGHGLMFATSGETLALMVAVPLCVFGGQRLLHKLRRVHQQAHFICDVEARFGNLAVQFVGLLDSGNQLYDPVSRRPVSFVNMDVLLPVLPESVTEGIRAGQDLLTCIASCGMSTAFTLVPFQGASGKGLTIALQPDSIVIHQADHQHIVSESHLFAVYPGKLSGEDTFRAILHMDLMNGDDEIEEISINQGTQYEVANSPAVALHSHSRQTPQ